MISRYKLLSHGNQAFVFQIGLLTGLIGLAMAYLLLLAALSPEPILVRTSIGGIICVRCYIIGVISDKQLQ